MHGADDTTVPFTATVEAGSIIRSCGIDCIDDLYIDGTGHEDTIMHFMIGGQTKDLVSEWMFRKHLHDNDEYNRKAGSTLLCSKY